MPSTSIFDTLPMWALVLGTALTILAAIRVGAWAGRRRRAEDPSGTPEAPLGTVVAAVLGLSAFVLGFTFSIAAARFDRKRELLLEEVNGIGTLYLRTSLAPEPYRGEVRTLLREYVDLRVKFTSDPTPAKFESMLQDSQRIHDACWARATAVVEGGARDPVTSLFVDSMNEVIDSHGRRVAIWRTRIPETIWVVLFALTTLSAAGVGFQFGTSGRTRLDAPLVLALVFAVMITLIADLDRSAEGFLRVDQRPMLELQESMRR